MKHRMSEEGKLYLALAATAGVEARHVAKACAMAGGIGALFEHPERGEEAVRGLGARIVLARRPAVVAAALETLLALSITPVALESDEYPVWLSNIEDPPLCLFVRGRTDLNFDKSIAMVGARRCTSYGASTAKMLARDVAACGVTVVSGLARGIDAWAHRGCMDGGAPTVAVLAGGTDVVYPPEHKPLYEEILYRGGSIISEKMPGTPSYAALFPIRNRIMAGMTPGLVVVEAEKQSGVVHTVRAAQAGACSVMAVPGNIDAPNSELPNALIADGARPILSADDILNELGYEIKGPKDEPAPVARALDAAEHAVYECVELEAKSFQQILAHTGFTVPALGALLTRMEFDGIIKQLPGRHYQGQRRKSK